MGGAVRAVEEGYMQQEIHRAALAIQREIESGKQVVVGVNRYRLEQETEPQLLRVDPAIAKQQVEQLRELKANRNATEVEEKLKRLKKAAQGTENLMPHILNAVKAYCTIGEICHVLREVFGEYRAG